MHRRSVLATAASLGVGAGVAGCVAGGSSPEAPDRMTVDTRYYEDDVLVDGLSSMPPYEEHDPYTALVATEEVAHERAIAYERTHGFLRDTEFEEAYVVVVQYTTQSARWLELDEIERTDGGVAVSVVVHSPDDGFADDAVFHSLAIRVSDEEAGVPGEVEATVSEAAG